MPLYTDNTAQVAAAAQWQTWRSTCLHFKTKYGNVHKMDYSNPFYNSRMVAYRYLSCAENVSTVHFYCYKFFIKKHFLHWFMQKIDSVDYFWKLQTVSFLNLFSQWAYYNNITSISAILWATKNKQKQQSPLAFIFKGSLMWTLKIRFSNDCAKDLVDSRWEKIAESFFPP